MDPVRQPLDLLDAALVGGGIVALGVLVMAATRDGLDGGALGAFAEGPFYHASSERLPVGEVLYSRGSAGRTPAVVDAARPDGVLPRNEHFFMVRNPDCLDYLGQDPYQHLYRVRPRAPVTRANYAWLDDAIDVLRGFRDLSDEELRDAERQLGEAGCSKSHRYGYWSCPEGIVARPEEVLAAELGERYWAGDPSPGRPCMDEYLTMAMEVEGEVASPSGWV